MLRIIIRAITIKYTKNVACLGPGPIRQCMGPEVMFFFLRGLWEGRVTQRAQCPFTKEGISFDMNARPVFGRVEVCMTFSSCMAHSFVRGCCSLSSSIPVRADGFMLRSTHPQTLDFVRARYKSTSLIPPPPPPHVSPESFFCCHEQCPVAPAGPVDQIVSGIIFRALGGFFQLSQWPGPRNSKKDSGGLDLQSHLALSPSCICIGLCGAANLSNHPRSSKVSATDDYRTPSSVRCA